MAWLPGAAPLLPLPPGVDDADAWERKYGAGADRVIFRGLAGWHRRLTSSKRLFTQPQVEQARRLLQALLEVFDDPLRLRKSASDADEDGSAEPLEDDADVGAGWTPPKGRASLAVQGDRVLLKLRAGEGGSSGCGTDDDDTVDDSGPVTRLQAAAAAARAEEPALERAVQASLVVRTDGTVLLGLLALRTEVRLGLGSGLELAAMISGG